MPAAPVTRILADGRDVGSAFALLPRLAVTAGHVVRGRDAAALAYATPGAPPVTVKRVEIDETLDVAVLHLAADTAGVLPVRSAVEGSRWTVDARPLGNDPRLSGTVTDARRRYVNARGHDTDGVQLLVEQELDDYGGYSGSPIVGAGGAALGVLVEQVRARGAAGPGEARRAANVLYAAPIDAVLERFGIVARRLVGREASRARSSKALGRLAELRRTNAFHRLGVKPEARDALTAAGVFDDVPYVERDIDEELRQTLSDSAARGGCAVVFVEGPARAGKSRTLLEVAAHALGEAWLAAPSDAAAMTALARRKPPAEAGSAAWVVWLDRLERFLRPADQGLNRDTIDAFEKWKRPVLLLGTVSHLSSVRGEQLIAERFCRVSCIQLAAELSADEVQRVVAAGYAKESAQRIADEGIGSCLTHARRLVDRFEHGGECREGVAVVRAAIDWRRAGMLRPVPAEYLERLYCYYLERRPVSQEFERGLKWATTPLDSDVALLSGSDPYDADAYVAEHYAQRHPIEAATWDEVINEYADGDELAFQVGVVADGLGDTDRAERAFRRADRGGHGVGARHLGVLLERGGDLKEAEEAYRRADTRGDASGANNLGLLLQKRSDLARAHAAFQRADEGGSAFGAVNLGTLLEGTDRRAALRAYQRADERGSVEGATSLGFLRGLRGDLDGAETAYRHADQYGSGKGAWYLGMLLRDRGDRDGAEGAFRRAVERGYKDAEGSLAMLLTEPQDR